MKDTKKQFEHVIGVCRDLFAKKLHDYGAAWRIMRPSSVTDQIFIKANRIRWWTKVFVLNLSLL